MDRIRPEMTSEDDWRLVLRALTHHRDAVHTLQRSLERLMNYGRPVPSEGSVLSALLQREMERTCVQISRLERQYDAQPTIGDLETGIAALEQALVRVHPQSAEALEIRQDLRDARHELARLVDAQSQAHAQKRRGRGW